MGLHRASFSFTQGLLGCRGTLLLLLGVLWPLATVLGLSCGPCEPSECPPIPGGPAGCPGGLATEPCGCCPVCARVVNQTCGGDFQILGKCDTGLRCAISPESTQPITGHEPGTCQVDESADAPAALPATSCLKAKCNVGLVPKCPSDSTVKAGKIVPGQCCPELPSCLCKPCLPAELSCPEGQLSLQTAKGANKPGQCCDVFECKTKAEVCAAVECEAEDLVPIDCPPDSFRPPPIITHNGCCQKIQGCVCRPLEHCEVPECEEGQQLKVITPALDLPGACCNIVECINDTQSCKHRGQEIEEGETWQMDACRSCTCNRGIAFCTSIKCETPGYCSWVGPPEGECCPVCKGCVGENGELHPNGASWTLVRDSCVTCWCVEGQVQCQATLCQTRCANARRVEGQCCPVCDEDESQVTFPPHCPPLNCSLRCLHGLLRDDQGCYTCQCQGLLCPLECPHGHVQDEFGTELCECAESPAVCKSMERCKKQCAYGFKINKYGCQKCRCQKCPPFLCKKKCVMGYQENSNGCKLCKCKGPGTAVIPTKIRPSRGCMSTKGHYMEDGESWHDGCRRCFCHAGREMCALITCPAPTCHNPVIRINDCCPTCQKDSVPSVPGEATRCQASDGKYHTEGETWMLDECTQCLCHKGGVLCEIESCAPVLCHHPVKLPHACCPVCPDGSDFFPVPSAEDRRSCTSTSGTHFEDGDSWRVNACQSCVCQNGQIHCFSQTCTPLACNKTLLRKGQCCPYCVDHEAPKTCIHDYEEYGSGEHWIIGDCTKCVCDNGHSMCTDIQCPALTGCLRLVKLDGVCCPICHNSTMVPTISGPSVTPGIRRPGKPDDEDWDDRFPQPETTPRSNKVAIGILVGAVALLTMLVVILLILLVRTRRKAHLHDPKTMLHSMHAVGDVKHRPKSTNVDFQGCSPLPSYTESVKMANWPKPPLEEDKNFRYSSAEDKTVKISLDVPCSEDPNNFRKSV